MKKILLATLVITLALTLTACPPEPPDPDPTHTHAYAATWSSNAAEHWHECSCGDKADIADHTGNPCTICGYNDPNHTHDYATTWSSDATQHWHECSCGDTTDAANHTAGDWIVDLAATDTTAGSQHKECTVCGYEMETGIIPIHSHTWGNYVETDAPTATADGVETRTCTTCGATDTQPVAGYRDKTITVTFDGTDYTAKVDGTLLLAEWNSIGTKLETAIQAAYADAPAGGPGVQYKNNFEDVFGRIGGAKITLEKAPTEGYGTWRIIGDGVTLYLNFAQLNNNLTATFKTVVPKMKSAETGME